MKRHFLERAGPSTSKPVEDAEILDESASTSSSGEDVMKDQDFRWSYSLDASAGNVKALKKSGQFRKALPNIAKIADMTGASNRTVAKIATATLHDFGLVSSENPKNVIDKGKVRRELNKKRKAVQKIVTMPQKPIQGIYFDGRKDQRMMLIQGRRVTK